ncbi:MAG: S46 family peptidase [Planctomycetes bacterium]|nr:S46 family peptidase [Planctomycetota bacterium]
MLRHLVFCAFALCALPSSLQAQDELGLGKMWTFHTPPLDYLRREYGFEPGTDWFDTVRLASLRFGAGCSAAFVSPQGLILTNHHCARDAIAKAQGAHDWVRDGYVATALTDEVRLPGLTVQQLVDMRDVTAEVEVSVDGNDPTRAEAQRQQNRERVLAAATTARPDLQPQLVKLFQGAVWQLYQYRVYDDVRLVMAPHLQTAHFGGDPDNFVYPRYAIDFAFCRAYVDGKPADTSAHWFRWSDGPQPGELLILTGNPGSTQRHLTKAQLEYQRDARYPRIRQLVDNRLEILRRLAAQDPATEKRVRTDILGLENAQKLFVGEHRALVSAEFLARKEKAEFALRNRIAARPELQARYGHLFADLAAVAADRKALEAAVAFHQPGGCALLLRAMALLQFARSGDEHKAKEARDIVVGGDPVQRAFSIDHLSRARGWLPADDPWLQAILGEALPAMAMTRFEQQSRLHESEVVERLIAGGAAAIDASDDRALQLARVLLPLQSKAKNAAAELEARENAASARLAHALFEVYGHAITPDATGTLRFSDGRAIGYDYNGTRAPWRTVFHGLFARHAEFDGQRPFDLPEPWLLAKDRIDLQAPVDFVCTVDSTGGNSGSPLINTRQELVGLLFDGNIESMANEFLYGESVERSVCVHPQAIVEALGKVYRASRLLRELGR